jgi:hypothetical protein
VNKALLNNEIGDLRELLIVPDDQIESIANSIFRESQFTRGQILTTAGAIAIPISFGTHLECVILIKESELDAIERGKPDVDYLALTIIEELFHVKHYTLTWNRRGFIHYSTDNASNCMVELLNFSFHLFDEYTVGRWKSDIIDHELYFGGNIPTYIDKGLREIAYIINQACKKEFQGEEIWIRIDTTMKQKIFGPLVRDAGRRHSLLNKPSPAGNPDDSQLYVENVKAYWDGINQDLIKGFDNLSEADEKILGIAYTLREFLERVGITLVIKENNICWLEFNNKWSSKFEISV